MKTTWKLLVAVALGAVLAGCKIEVPVPAGGYVTTESGSFTCYAGQTCVIEANDLTFDETFIAVADDGMKFVNWKQRDRGFFGGNTNNSVRLFTSGFSNNEVLLSILRSNQIFYLEPVFEEVIPEPNDSSNVGFKQVEYGNRSILYVLVDFSDWNTVLDDQVHLDRMYGSVYGVRDYYSDLFKRRIEITAPPESYGAQNDGLIRVKADQPHPNDPKNRDAMTAAVISTAAQIEQYVDAKAMDRDGNGYLTPDELTIAFIVAGRSTCRGTRCIDEPLPQVRGFAKWNYFQTDERSSIVLDGIEVPYFSVQPERGTYSTSGIDDDRAIVTLIHETGHAVFGISDHYGEYDGQDDVVRFLNEWCLFSSSRLRRPSDDRAGPQIIGGYGRLETNLIRAQEIDSDTSLFLESASVSSLSEDRIDSSLARVWLDPYRVRESIIIEYRDNQGYDSFLGGMGALLTEVQSLATRGKGAPSEYRRARLVEGSGYDGSLELGQVNQFVARIDTPGFSDDPQFPDRSVTIRYGGISQRTASFDVSIEDFGPERGNLRYDVSPESEENGFARNFRYGFPGKRKAFAGTLMFNNTDFNVIDGYEISVQADSTLTFEVYELILDDGVPFNLLTSESVEVSGVGWQRIFLDNPLSFPPGEARFVTIGVETPSVETFVLGTSKSGMTGAKNIQSYSSSDGLRYPFTLKDSVFRKILLLSRTADL